MTHTVAALFDDQEQARAAILDLRAAGIDDTHIGLVGPDLRSSVAGATEDVPSAGEARSTEGANAGALGAVLVAAGALSLPAVGPFITGGLLATLIGGAAGWLVGGLTGMGVRTEDASYYERQVQAGKTLVAVRLDGHEADAEAILRRHGGQTGRDEAGASGGEPQEATGQDLAPSVAAGGANRAWTSGQMDDMERSRSWDGTIPPTAEREAVTAPPPSGYGSPGDAPTRLPNDETFNGVNPTAREATQQDRTEKYPPASPPDQEIGPNPVPLSPTDPRRRTDEGQPYLDDANPYGRAIPNRQGEPMGGVGTQADPADPQKRVSHEQPGTGEHPLPQALDREPVRKPGSEM